MDCKTRKIMEKKGLDGILLCNLRSIDPNMLYLASFDAEFSFLFYPKKGNSILFVSEMEYERAKRQSTADNVRKFGKDVFVDITGEFKKRKAKAVGIDYGFVTIRLLNLLKKHSRGIRYKDIGKEILWCRSQKEEDEIQKIRKACSISDKILQKCITNFKRFKTEADAVSFLVSESLKVGTKPAFPPIVASGRTASMPHHKPNNNKLQKGFCIIDFGVKFQDYNADMTRTIYIGKPKKEEILLYDKMLDCYKRTIMQIRPTMMCRTLAKKVEKMLGEKMIHSLGHGVGIEVHESPSISVRSKDKFEKSSVFAIEPGIYRQGKYGIRIEDTVALIGNNPEILTKTKKELIVIS